MCPVQCSGNYSKTSVWLKLLVKIIREAVKKNLNVNFFQKGLHFEILSFGKFQVAKWASGMKRLLKASFKN